METGRNALCPCGSGKKYKKCCINKTKESTWKENFDKLNIEIDKKEELKEILFRSYEFMEKEDWKGACHAISAIQYVIFNELELNPKICIGVVGWSQEPFDHSWIEIENQVYDIAIDNTLTGVKVSEPIIAGYNIETLQKTDIKYGIEYMLDEEAMFVKEVSITDYLDGNMLLWNLIFNFAKSVNLNLNLQKLREKYSKTKRTFVH